MNLNDLFQTIKNRRREKPEGSYVASLFREGEDRIIQKVGEEAVETVIAAKNPDKNRLVSEIADLWFHTLILMEAKEIKLEDIEKTLEERKK